MSTKALQVIVLVLAACCTGWAHARLPNQTRAELGEGFVPSPGVAKALAFGFDALLADYHWLQAVQVVGRARSVEAPEARQVGKLVDVVTTLNPHVDHPYRFAAIWLTHDEALVREGIRLLQRSIEYHPDDWRNYFYLGFNHFFYLGEYEEAAEVLEIAMEQRGAPAYLPRLVARLRSQTQDIEVAEVFLRELLRGSAEGEARAKVQAALDEIEIEHKARHLDRAREAYRALAGRDLDRVEDLVRGPHRVLESLPSPEPDSLPRALSRGSVWKIDAKTDRIVSSYVGSRYEVYFSSVDRQRLQSRDQPGEGPRDAAREDAKREG